MIKKKIISAKIASEKLIKWREHDVHAPKCENAINIAMRHCIKRHLFFNCPNKTPTPECGELEKFGKECPMFPMPPFPRRHGKGAIQATEPKSE